jgi:hypothetical protein
MKSPKPRHGVALVDALEDLGQTNFPRLNKEMDMVVHRTTPLFFKTFKISPPPGTLPPSLWRNFRGIFFYLDFL